MLAILSASCSKSSSENLLGEHVVAYRKSALGHEAQKTHAPTFGIELLDVHLKALVDAVASSRDAARDFDVFAALILLALR